jgi:crossover junction endodeoxyribonuclease RusA
MTTSYTITLPLPHKHLSPNARPHWRAKAKATKTARTSVAVEVAAVMSFYESVAPRWKTATVLIRAYFKDARKRDKDNIMASCKAYFDGLADAGLIDNDSGLTHLPMVVAIDKKNPRIEMVVTKQD